MIYATVEYYKQKYKGSSVPDVELERYLRLASKDIDLLTLNKSQSYNSLNAYQKDVICMATCYEVDYLYANKGVDKDSFITYNSKCDSRFSRITRNIVSCSGLDDSVLNKVS